VTAMSWSPTAKQVLGRGQATPFKSKYMNGACGQHLVVPTRRGEGSDVTPSTVTAVTTPATRAMTAARMGTTVLAGTGQHHGCGRLAPATSRPVMRPTT
jgi:hypothetical protein